MDSWLESAFEDSVSGTEDYNPGEDIYSGTDDQDPDFWDEPEDDLDEEEPKPAWTGEYRLNDQFPAEYVVDPIKALHRAEERLDTRLQADALWGDERRIPPPY